MGTPDYFDELFAGAAIGLAVTGCTGKVIRVNQAMAKIIDRNLDDVDGLNLFELTHPDDQKRHRTLLQQLLATKIPGYVIEKRYLRRDGTAVWVRNSVSLVKEKGAGEAQLIHICEDFSERKRTEHILQQQEQMAAIGRLTSSMVHEINNPLEATFNLIYLARQAAHPGEADTYLEAAEEELRRVCEITMQGLQFHRQSKVPALVDVADILRTVLVLFRGKFREAKIRIEVATDDGSELMCFAGEVRQVFVNLIGNAVESMKGGGLLNLRVRPGTDWRTGVQGVRVTIADTGCGMDEEIRERIFEAFYTTKGSNGSGLGLWVTANLVRKHRGSIHVRSRAGTGSGTIFSLVFPCRGAEGKSAGFQDAA